MKNSERYIHELSHAPRIFPRYWFRSHTHSINKFLRLPYLKNRTINLSALLRPRADSRYTHPFPYFLFLFSFFLRGRSHLRSPAVRASASLLSREKRSCEKRSTRWKRPLASGRTSDITRCVRPRVVRSSNYLVTTVITIIVRDVGARGAENDKSESCSGANQETLCSTPLLSLRRAR